MRIALMIPAKPGSLGDQAMADVVAGEFARAARVSVFPFAPDLRADVRVVTQEGWKGPTRASLNAILGAGHVALIGADMIDGGYSRKASLSLMRALRLAHLLGRQTRILGSSWSETPDPVVREAYRGAGWLEVLARDPISQQRMERDFGRPVPLVADTAFLLEPEARRDAAVRAVDWSRARRGAGGTVLAVNLSGHTVSKTGDVGPFRALIAEWLAADPARACLVLPHDFRGRQVGDVEINEALHAALAGTFGDRLHLVEGRIDAWDAKAIVGEADVVLTGRMHLAIASLGMGTPPLCAVYMGKFEGLMQHFGLSGLTFAPTEIGAGVAAQLDEVTRRAPERRRDILARLPAVREMSRLNFAGFPG